MKADQSKHDAGGKLKNGEFKEFFKDGTLACVGKYRNGEKVGEWKYYLPAKRSIAGRGQIR